jgi:hypothetical protein
MDRSQPDDARRVIERYIAHLRERTRARSRFPVVVDANTTYGFRRNCLGLRPIALGIALTATGTGSVLDWLRIAGYSHAGSPVALGLASVASVIATGAWWRAGSEWVRAAANYYAVALLDSAETLDSLATPHA